MKKRNFLRPSVKAGLLAAALSTVLAIAGCRNPLDDMQESLKSDTTDGRSLASLSLRITTAYPSVQAPRSRTIMPSTYPGIDSYDISFSGGPTAIDPIHVSSTTGLVIELPLGQWTITVNGNDDIAGVVATGSDSIDLQPGDNALDITITPQNSGAETGSVALTVDWPESVTADVFYAAFYPIGGNPIEVTGSLTGTGSQRTYTKTDVVSGDYQFVCKLYRGVADADHMLVAFSEIVKVYDNISTTETVEIDETHINAAPQAPSDLIATARSSQAIELQWTDNAITEDHFVLERSSDGGTYTVVASTIPANTTSYADDDPPLDSDSLYYYRIKAVNTFGESETVGPASARTDIAPGGEMWTGLDTLSEEYMFSSAALNINESTGELEYLYVGAVDNNTGIGYIFALDADGNEVWRYSVDGHGMEMAPVVTETAHVLAGCKNGTLYIFDLADADGDGIGDIAGTFPTGGEITASPAIGTDGTIYLGSKDNNLYAIDNTTFSETWRFPAGDEITTSPSVASDGTIYFFAYDTNPDGGRTLYALSPDGNKKWHYTDPSGELRATSPAVGSDGTLFFFSDQGGTYRLHAFYPGGVEKWHYDISTSEVSNPLIGSDDTIYFTSNEGTNGDQSKLYAINPEDTDSDGQGDIRWSYTVGIPLAPNGPAIGTDGSNDILLFSAINMGSYSSIIYAIDQSGNQAWPSLTHTSTFFISNPAIGPDGTAYLTASYFGTIKAIRTECTGPASGPWPFQQNNPQRTSGAAGMEVSGLSGTFSGGTIDCTWTNPPTSTYPDFDYCTVYYGENRIADTVEATNVTTEAASVSGLTDTVVYAFTITCVDTEGNESAGSTILIGDVEPPADVTNLSQAGSGETYITLSWTNPTEDFDHCIVLYKQNTESDYTEWGAQITSGSVTITGLQSGTFYNFIVKAVDAMGNRSDGVSEPYSTTGVVVEP